MKMKGTAWKEHTIPGPLRQPCFIKTAIMQSHSQSAAKGKKAGGIHLLQDIKLISLVDKYFKAELNEARTD